ncbi:3-oxoacyl-ACP reductase FabG [Xanthomonas campestris pv. campestris]|uniref:3-oxoacyl-ACP reductase FabG n=1 Tax=Xanthomonas campestris TaxID=339 RepID=UPI001E5EF2A1|nr:3-oxoacyl-ACP reductase FabG [Xanthomonas campestris]MCD0252497.1 3-oxoacyl-ACP reductase FabG [Xanthomonas campestris pv. campestris]MEB1300211.1 3-oxoacyl-ACP reductase FabG [Xanthomonas campestris pv. campestris]MEB1309005.1 3-oxoacyl-ACP reductase FabG [Xanthomonas campestris pv. campestris]MEB1334064.1 3-oxoacyl-ACP reductase FabG [Xanthomonas campestris pv. campestris]MEB1903060.1 3-oxoacyl-ACP reductase FabG [Xanthomonas campestris pv. campestris]
MPSDIGNYMHQTERDGRKWVLVTGGSRGIGRGLVEALCAVGYEVAFTYRKSAESAGALEAEIAERGGCAHGHHCDSSDAAAVRELAQELVSRNGAPYGLINNAGVTRDALMMRMSDEEWGDVIGNNLNAAFYVTRAFLPAMAENGGGCVLHMSSVAGHRGSAGQTNYSATKAALSGMTRSLAVEMGRFDLRVNAIAPGYIETDMIKTMPDAQRRSIRSAVPLRRIGTAEDIAAVAVFLLGPGAAYITGQTFVVDGGLTA